MATLLQEDFEDSTLTYTVSVPDDLTDAANKDYFGIVGAGDLPSDVVYTNADGSYYAVQDTNGVPTNPVDTITLTFGPVDITDFTNLSVSGLFAEDQASNGNQDWDTTSSLRIEVSIDGGPFVPVLAFESELGTDGNQTNEVPRQDTDFDGVGDGAALTDVFTEFSGAIAGTGSSLTMRLVIEDLETADEDVAFDNITITGDPVCFTRGAMIATPEGPRAIETLAAGDLVITRDHRAQPLRWVGSRRVLAEEPALRPVRIQEGALGQGLPERDLVVSRHHGMLVTGWRAALLFDAGEALVAAVDLVNDSTITLEPAGEVEYFHLLFDAHQIVMAEGAWTESYKPLARDLSFFNAAQEREILGLFPELELAEGPAFASARPVASKRDAALFS